MRYSFLEAKPSTYLPLNYPDRQPLLDDKDQPIRLQNGTFPCTKQVVAQTGGTDCSSAAMDEFAKFGFFRTVRQTYDPNYGATEQGRQYLANRWNIWKDGAAAMAAQPDRTTREIAYYTNPEFPEDPDLFSTAQEIVGSWNDAMKQTVSSLNLTQQQQGGIIPLSNVQQAATSLKDIFVLKKNSCNLQGVKDLAGKYNDLADAVENATGDSVDNLTVAQPAHGVRGDGAGDAEPGRRRRQEVHLAAQRRPALLVPALGRPPAGERPARVRAVVGGSGDR